MSVAFSQMPSGLLMSKGVPLSAVKVWHVVYCETLGRPGWDLSYGQIAEKIGTARRATAMEAVDWLVTHGWLVKIEQHADERQRPNLYRVCREPFIPWNEDKVVRPSVPTGPVERTETGTADRTHRDNHNRDMGETRTPRRTASKPFPEGWIPDEALVAWTKETCPLIDPRREWEQFRDHALANDRRQVDWRRAWMTWARRGQQFAESRRGKVSPKEQRDLDEGWR